MFISSNPPGFSTIPQFEAVVIFIVRTLYLSQLFPQPYVPVPGPPLSSGCHYPGVLSVDGGVQILYWFLTQNVLFVRFVDSTSSSVGCRVL